MPRCILLLPAYCIAYTPRCHHSICGTPVALLKCECACASACHCVCMPLCACVERFEQ